MSAKVSSVKQCTQGSERLAMFDVRTAGLWNVKLKSKVHPRTGHDDPEGE